MIRPLRQRHRRMITVLGVILPVAFATGVVARKPIPTIVTLPAALAMTSQHFETVEWERADLFTKAPIVVRLLREKSAAGRSAVALSAPKDFVRPDVIVYWIAGSPNLTDTVPDDARLLGAFNSTLDLPLPPAAASVGGVLMLYSLADQEVIDVSKPFTLQKP